MLGFLVATLVPSNTIFIFLLTIVLAFFIPDFWLNLAVKKRREKLRMSLPDGLDLLAICMEAGLGLDQGIVRVGQELRVSHPELSEELLQINFEQRAGAPRIAAWKSFSERADSENVRSFVAMRSRPIASERQFPSHWEISPTRCERNAGKRQRRWRPRRRSN